MFLGAVHSYSKADNCSWVVKLSLNREMAEFKIDTGADVTVIPSEMHSLDRDGPLKRPTRVLSGPDKSPLTVKGSFTGQLERGKMGTKEEVYVVDNLSKPLVGKPAIIALKLLSFLHVDNLEASSVEEKFPDTSKGRCKSLLL